MSKGINIELAFSVFTATEPLNGEFKGRSGLPVSSIVKVAVCPGGKLSIEAVAGLKILNQSSEGKEREILPVFSFPELKRVYSTKRFLPLVTVISLGNFFTSK